MKSSIFALLGLVMSIGYAVSQSGVSSDECLQWTDEDNMVQLRESFAVVEGDPRSSQLKWNGNVVQHKGGDISGLTTLDVIFDKDGYLILYSNIGKMGGLGKPSLLLVELQMAEWSSYVSKKRKVYQIDGSKKASCQVNMGFPTGPTQRMPFDGFSLKVYQPKH